MKFLFFLAIIGIGVSGYLAYEKGQLASIHPLLDPMTHNGGPSDDETATATADESSDRKSTQPDANPDIAEAPAKTKAKSKSKPDPKLARAQQAEERRLKDEEKKLARAAEKAASEAAEEVYQAKRAVIQGHLAALDQQYSDIEKQIREAEFNRNQQETAWASKRIGNSREREKQRASTTQFLEKLDAQKEVIFTQRRVKSKELADLAP